MRRSPTPSRTLGSVDAFSIVPTHILSGFIRRRLAEFRHGAVRLHLPNGDVIEHRGEVAGPEAVLHVKRWRLLGRLLMEGEIGLARSYVDGDWSTPDLATVMAFGLANGDNFAGSASGSRVAHLLNRLGHGRNANTRKGSRRNIAAHYDLGNDFYAHWLDPDMTYSSALYERPEESLETAQARKLERAVELLDLDGGEKILEIGCGWGSLARRLAGAGAGQVTGISLSQEQISLARERVARDGLSDRVSFELRDYRDVSEQFDRIVSIEMFEAVGEKYWPVFFDQVRRSLAPDGIVVMQVITIADELFESYRRRPDFIQQFIFPGGMLPTVSMVDEEARRAGFRRVAYEPFGASYALTLDQWRGRFKAAWPQIEPLGFDDRFERMWDYYLTYCASGFRFGSIDVGFFKFVPR
jgi:cyclopropane-fatty-acyl-phospholipid synthase